jgi:hypothetical protein
MSDVYSCSWVLPNEESEVDEPVWLLAEYLNLRLPALDLSVVPIFRLTRKQSNRSALIAINQVRGCPDFIEAFAAAGNNNNPMFSVP